MRKEALNFVKDMMAFIDKHPDADIVFAGVFRVNDDKTESEVIAQASPDGMAIAATALLQGALDISTDGDCGGCLACKERAAWIREVLAKFPADLVGTSLDDAIGATEGRC